MNNNYLRGLTRRGHLFDIALNRLVGKAGNDRSNDEFAGRPSALTGAPSSSTFRHRRA